jgi:hypothetical protein
MLYRSLPKLAFTFLIVFLMSRPAQANVIAPALLFCPGILPFTGALAFPASILAAIIERPFVQRAGVPHAIWFSLQANFLSLLLGFVLVFAFAWSHYVLSLLWCLLAVAMSIVCEGGYYRAFAFQRDRKLGWGWIAWGNLASSLVLGSISMSAEIVGDLCRLLARDIEPYADVGSLVLFGVSLVVFLASFLVPYVLREKPARIEECGAFAGQETPV